MNFVKHPSNNYLYTAPSDMPDCGDLPVTRYDEDGATVLCSFWMPEPAELEALNRGKPVMLYVYSPNLPPVALGVEA